MPPKPGALVLCVVAAALLVASCSTGGGNHATPTTKYKTTSATTTTLLPSHVVVNLGACPSTYPTESLKALNAGIDGLGTKLVPIAVSSVLVCRYLFPGAGARLIASNDLSPEASRKFVVETNRLLMYSAPPGNRTCPDNGPGDYLTFASDTQQVNVNDGACGLVANGVFAAAPTQTWLNDLQHYATSSTATGRVLGTVRLIGRVPPKLHGQIPGTVIATDSSGNQWRATTAATRPFALTLPVGTYRFTGSALITKCGAPNPVMVVSGKTTQVEVVCDVP